MAKKVQLKDNNGNKAYPVTSSACVGMSDGSGSLDKKIAGMNSKISYVNCTTGAGTAAKTVPLSDFALSTGIRLVVKMSYANTAASATLNVNNTGAKTLYYNGNPASADNTWEAGEVLDVYYDGANYQSSSFQGGGAKAEKIEFDNSDTLFESENVQGVLNEASKIINTHNNEIDNIFKTIQKDNLSDSIIFSSTGGLINANTGSVSSSQNTVYTESYIQISTGYITISLPSSSSNEIAGIAFYDDSLTFISGFVAPKTSTQQFNEYRIEIPEGAKYFRTTRWNDNVMSSNRFEFKCAVAYNIPDKIDEIEDDLTTLIDKSDEVTISRINKFLNYKNGTIFTSAVNTQASENYINVEGVKGIQFLASHSNTVATEAGYAFYDSEKKYLFGAAFISDSGEIKSAMETIEVPNIAKYFRYTIYNKEIHLAFKHKLKDIVNIKESNEVDLIGRSIFAEGHFFISYINGAITGSDIASKCTNGYINIKGFKKIKTLLFQSTASDSNAGMAFYDDEYNFLSSVKAQSGASEYGNTDVTINVPENAAYFANTIYDSNNGNYDFYYLIGYKEDDNNGSEEPQEDNSNYNDLRLNRIDVNSPSITVNGDDLLGLSMDKTAVNCSIKCRFKDKTIYEENGEIAYQGATSLTMPKKGFTLTFSEKHRFKDWIEMDEYHCKGYYSDWLHCRDLLANRILEQVILTRPQNSRRSYQFNNKFDTKDFELLVDSGALCHVDGFPVELYINDSYWGLYSLNIKKERDNYKLEKDSTDHIQIEASTDVSYGNDASFNWGGVEIRCPKSDSGNEEFVANATPNDGEVKTAWIGFLTNLNAIDEDSMTKENLEAFLNLQDWIDNILVCWFLNHTDNWSKNTLYTTWDAGVHWSPLLYDMDNTFGIVDITGGSVKPYNYNTFEHKAYNNCPWLSKIETILSNEIKSRYAELRKKGIFTAENVDNLVTSWVKEVGTDVYKDDTERWSYPGLGNGGSFIDSQYRIFKWISDRLGYLDEKYEYTE